MDKAELAAYIGGVVRLALQAGLGAWLARHGVADTEAFAALAVIVLTGAWSIYAKRRAIYAEPPKERESGMGGSGGTGGSKKGLATGDERRPMDGERTGQKIGLVLIVFLSLGLLAGCMHGKVKANPDGSWEASGWSFWKEAEIPTLDVRIGTNVNVRLEGVKTTNNAAQAAVNKLGDIASGVLK